MGGIHSTPQETKKIKASINSQFKLFSIFPFFLFFSISSLDLVWVQWPFLVFVPTDRNPEIVQVSTTFDLSDVPVLDRGAEDACSWRAGFSCSMPFCSVHYPFKPWCAFQVKFFASGGS
mmetsp:Transcript_13460/g.24020  ORF Transcript_13460/g.24020 Transcript_13460/m.24020 type:complete len:119 (-) Transcript_13460:286-642(-)